jgi:formylglycine-generating enzyme required for sulfatase activity
VVRGGAWNYRAKHSAAYSRESNLAWQPANNVGFRVVIEE